MSDIRLSLWIWRKTYFSGLVTIIRLEEVGIWVVRFARPMYALQFSVDCWDRPEVGDMVHSVGDSYVVIGRK